MFSSPIMSSVGFVMMYSPALVFAPASQLINQQNLCDCLVKRKDSFDNLLIVQTKAKANSLLLLLAVKCFKKCADRHGRYTCFKILFRSRILRAPFKCALRSLSFYTVPIRMDILLLSKPYQSYDR